VPVEEIVQNTTREWFRQNLPLVDPDRHLRYQVELKQGSQSLVDVFERGGGVVGANDTSAAVGFAPMTMTERIVLETDVFLNSGDFAKRHPEVGRGTKVMGVRRYEHLHLTVAAPFVDRFVESEAAYFRQKEEVRLETRSFVRSRTTFSQADVALNTADVRGRGVNGAYLTVLGTPADGADSGQVGRGNRVNGIIPLNRPTCSEAAAGKNPVNHVGKIYNFLTYRIANRIHAETPGVREAYVWLLSKIGQPIDQPKIASVQLLLTPGTALTEVSGKVEELVSDELANIMEFSSELAHGRLSVC
jgi:S-adenosylmethionine synthetase